MVNPYQRFRHEELFSRLPFFLSVGWEVIEVDYAQKQAKCQLNENFYTGWIPFMATRSGSTKTWCAPAVGERVCLLAPNGDLRDAIIPPWAFYAGGNEPPTTDRKETMIEFEDGSFVKYNAEDGYLEIDMAQASDQDLIVNAPSGRVLIKAQEVIIDGKLTVKEDIKGEKEISDQTGSMTRDRDLYDGHTHQVIALGSPTLAAQPKQGGG